MAGRPAAPRGGGGLMYGLVTFVIMTVIFLGLFIWQLTDNQRLADAADRAATRVSKLGSPPAYYQTEADNRRGTVFDAMNGDMEQLALLVAGKKDAVWAAIKPEADRLRRSVASLTGESAYESYFLLTALANLSAAYQEQGGQVKRLDQMVADLQSQNQGLADGVRVAREEFEAQVAEMKTEVERLEQEKVDQMAAKDEQLTQVQESADAVTEELNRYRVETTQSSRLGEVEVARLQRQIDDLQAKIRELRPGGFDANEILTKADGKILRAIPGSDVVFVNLGQGDRIRPGLTFEVFSPRGERTTGIRGKASIEVTAVSEDTAECRVTRQTPGRPIVEGDILVNIAYERNRLPKFVIRGEFDLNYDGTVDWDGAERVTAIIREWGGEVIEDVDETTDFLVLGMGPQVSSLASRRQVSPVFEDLVNTQTGRLEEYRDTIDRARTLYIPIVLQNQFMFLTGYAGQEDVVSR